MGLEQGVWERWLASRRLVEVVAEAGLKVAGEFWPEPACDGRKGTSGNCGERGAPAASAVRFARSGNEACVRTSSGSWMYRAACEFWVRGETLAGVQRVSESIRASYQGASFDSPPEEVLDMRIVREETRQLESGEWELTVGLSALVRQRLSDLTGS